MRYLKLLIFAIVLSFGYSPIAFSQTTNFSSGALSVDVTVSNECDVPGAANGFITFTVVGSGTGDANLNVIVGPVSKFTPTNIPVGGSYTFNLDDGGSGLPDGNYRFYIEDGSSTDIIDQLAPGAGVFVEELEPITITSTGTTTDNTSCGTPNGQIEVLIENGSLKDIAPNGSISYTWTSDNGLAGLPLTINNATGSPDFTANLLTDLQNNGFPGLTGLPGGQYSITVDDDFSVCSGSLISDPSLNIADPSPSDRSFQNPGPRTVCTGSGTTIVLENSETPSPISEPDIFYQLQVDGADVGAAQVGTGGDLTYNLGSGDFSDGSVITIIASQGACTPNTMSDNVTITLSPAPTVSAGSDESVCAGGSFDLSSSGTVPTESNSASLLWTTSGDGSFDDDTALTPVYNPGAADITAGTVTLTLQANPIAPCTVPATDDMTLTIVGNPVANAGSDETICEGDDLDLSTSATVPTATNASSLLWTTSGDGSFDDDTALTPIYTPGAADITAGTVTLTLEANPFAPCVVSDTDDMILTITASPTVDAGSDESICAGDDLDLSTSATVPTATNASSLQWTSSGDGSFDDDTALTPIYSPGAADITAGTVTLTLQANPIAPCTVPVTDDMTLTIVPNPIANAGSDEEICAGDVQDLSTSSTVPTVTNASSLLWTTSGDGGFDNDAALTPIYTPGAADIIAGTVTLTLQANPIAPCGVPDTDDMILTITAPPTANAGSDETVCEGSSFDLSTSATAPTATNASSLLWTTSGDGGFDDDTALTPIYTPGAADITAGTVTLTLQANGNGSCAAVTDDMVLTVEPAPTANAGSDEEVCAGDALDLSTSATVPTATNASSLLWTSSGDGSFDDDTALTP
ncbi:MAG: hypothetical protein ABJH05_11195, partial [Fulvivirga sp.]